LIGVIVPMESWRETESERETAYLLKSENMKRRLLEAQERQDGIPLEEAREKLGI
jgi:PHD/YefM family antitoxin component YafN of YafNO toxin-antitoxin module